MKRLAREIGLDRDAASARFDGDTSVYTSSQGSG